VHDALELLRTEGVEIDGETSSAIDRYAADEIAFTDVENQFATTSESDSETVSKIRMARERVLTLIRQESKLQGVMLWQNPYRNKRDSISEVRPASEPRPKPPRK
jgi:hypothetical protein